MLIFHNIRQNMFMFLTPAPLLYADNTTNFTKVNFASICHRHICHKFLICFSSLCQLILKDVRIQAWQFQITK